MPPIAKRIRAVTPVHGELVANDYEWMRNLEDPDLETYVRAENIFAEAQLAPLSDLRTDIEREVAAGGGGVSEPPRRYGSYAFLTVPGAGEYEVWARQPTAGGGEPEAFLDLNEIGAGHAFVELGLLRPTDDGELVAYTVDLLGDERFTLSVVDLRAGRTVVSGVANVDSVAWAADGETLFYVVLAEEPWRAQRLFRLHVPTSHHELVYQEKDRSLALSVRRATGGEFVYVDVLGSASNACAGPVETRVLPAGRPTDDLAVLHTRSQGHECAVEHHRGRAYRRMNDVGPDFRLTCDDEELLPMEEGACIESMHVFREHVVAVRWQGGQRHARVVDLASRRAHTISTPAPPYDLQPLAAQDADSGCFRYLLSTPVAPPELVEYDLAACRSTGLSRAEIPGYDPARYEVLRLEAPAPDGTRIPVSLVRRRAADGPPAVLLHAYGHFGYSRPTGFDATLLSLLDRGVGYAIAHPRGGGELGRRWHDAGRLDGKVRTYTDFIAVAEFLVAEGYAEPGRLGIRGKSAGGTLVTAAANMRPDLFGAVIAMVPYPDPLHVMLDDTMPWTVVERSEWGDPYRSEAELRALASYCPYTNLEPRPYPPMYVTASRHDSQCPYWQPAKYVARLRAVASETGNVVLRTRSGCGHAGPSTGAGHARELAYEYAFAIDRLTAGSPAATTAMTR